MFNLKAVIICLVIASLMTIVCDAQKSDFRPGHFYDKKGRKFKGYLDLSNVFYNTIKFKPTLQSEEINVTAAKTRGIVVESDSFTILRNFGVESNYSNNYTRTVSTGLARILETGKVILYQTYYEDSGNPYFLGVNLNTPVRYVYMIRVNGTDKVTAVEMGIDDFVRQMNAYFGMSPEIRERIQKREYSYLKVQQLVRDFNQWYVNR